MGDSVAHRLIDLSVALRDDIRSDPPEMLPKIEYHTHQMTAPHCAGYFEVPVEALPEGQYAAMERCTISSHNGTHVDAPYHYFSRMNEAIVPGGEPSMRIDEVPLEWLYQPGVKLDFRHLPDGYLVQPADIQAELDRIGHVLEPLETLWLVEQGVKVVGTDGWSWDAPFSHTKRRVAETGDAGLIWEGHRVGRDRAYCQIEKMSNLDQLPPDGFIVSAFPVKLHRGSAGWTRAVAILPA